LNSIIFPLDFHASRGAPAIRPEGAILIDDRCDRPFAVGIATSISSSDRSAFSGSGQQAKSEGETRMIKLLKVAVPALALFVAACAVNPVRVIQPVSAEVRGASHIADVAVTISPLAAEQMVRFEDKARENRERAGLPPVPAEGLATRPPQDEYATLPFAEMMELVIQDVTRAHGLDAGRPLRLQIEIDTLKTANAGMAILAGSSDQLAGTVRVVDAQSGASLGEFYVDVINSHSGLLGLAMRGGGIREELAEEFSLHIARQLRTGRDRG
jgi:hypothetical protein